MVSCATLIYRVYIILQGSCTLLSWREESVAINETRKSLLDDQVKLFPTTKICVLFGACKYAIVVLPLNSTPRNVQTQFWRCGEFQLSLMGLSIYCAAPHKHTHTFPYFALSCCCCYCFFCFPRCCVAFFPLLPLFRISFFVAAPCISFSLYPSTIENGQKTVY